MCGWHAAITYVTNIAASSSGWGAPSLSGSCFFAMAPTTAAVIVPVMNVVTTPEIFSRRTATLWIPSAQAPEANSAAGVTNASPPGSSSHTAEKTQSAGISRARPPTKIRRGVHSNKGPCQDHGCDCRASEKSGQSNGARDEALSVMPKDTQAQQYGIPRHIGREGVRSEIGEGIQRPRRERQQERSMLCSGQRSHPKSV